VIAQPPIQFDRASGALEGANLWERTAALALAAGSKVSSHFSHRGYNMCANLLRKTLPERDIAIKLNRDATFAFPYGDGYWSKLLNRSFAYENELDLLFRRRLHAARLRRQLWLLVGAGLKRALRVAQGGRDRAVGAEFPQARQQRRNQRQPL
jgi:hypothetical protein